MSTAVTSMPISFKQQRWVLPGQAGPAGKLLAAAPDAGCVARLAAELRVPGVVAMLLANRGLVERGAAAAFLEPQFRTLHEPALLPNMGEAVARIAEAVAGGQRIALYGDYDVDGITGTAMLWHILKAAGVGEGKLQAYIPHRVAEGYGINSDAMAKLIDEGAELIVSVDCGVSAIEPLRLARERGVDVIVTDHHEFAAELPTAVAIVHPRLVGSAYPNADLCGAGVAYKLAWGLATHFCGGQKVNGTFKALLIDFAALVGLATIADVVPLTGENRVLVKYGLQQIPRCSFAGMRALVAAAGYACGGGEGRKVDCTAVGFGLAPRLNAAGRMDHADLAVELFTTATAERAAEIAGYLEAQNRQRQATERRMVEDAKEQIAAWAELPAVIVVHSEEHHAGVVGIVASRLVDQFHRPAFVLACDDGECHGSARSIAGFDIHSAIEHCRHLLISGGGHAMAGGVKLRRENLEAFRECLNGYAAGVLGEEHFVPVLAVDGELTLGELDVGLVNMLKQFEPFGRGNPPPRFVVRGARLDAPPRRVGVNGAHVQLQFSQGGRGGKLARGIAFKAGPVAAALQVGMEIDLVVEPKIDAYNGRERVDLVVVDLARSDGLAFEGVAGAG